MAISGLQVIDIGLQNESTGSDSLYTAFNKTKNNFAILANTANYSNFTGNTGIAVTSNANAGTVNVTNTGVISIIAGTNITVDSANGNVTINSTGGSGGGTITSVGITPVSSSRITVTNTPITTTGNISIDLANSGAVSGSYSLPNITVDSYGRITNISNGTSVGSQITNGNSNVIVGANSEVTVSVSGTSNVLVVSTSGLTVDGNIIAGNLSATQLTGTLTTAAQPNITSIGTLSSLIVSGNINSGNVIGIHYGAATGLTSIPGANVTGAVSFATTANSVAGANVSGTVGFATTANGVAGANVTGVVANATYAVTSGTTGTVTTNAQPNITSVGTLTSLIINGNLNAGNAIYANYFIGNGSSLTGLNGANVTGSVANAAYATNALVAATAARAGVVTTAAQPNITSVGTLTSLTVSGNAIIGNISTSGQIVATGNVTANNFIGGGSGTPTLSSNTNLDLSAGTAVRVVGGGTLRLPNLTTAQIANIIASNGDMVYNSTTNKLQAYVNGAWGNVTVV